MSRHSRYELRRTCAKCNITATEDRKLSFHRFPAAGRRTMLKARVWAEFCYPTGKWSTQKSLSGLHTQHKMLCSKHFDDSSFTSSARIRLNNYAIPIGTQDLLVKFREEHWATTSASEQDTTNISVEKPQVLVTTESSLPVQEPTIDNPITSLPVHGSTICQPTTDSLKKAEKREIISFHNTQGNILSKDWYENKKSTPAEERLRIVEAAAAIIREDIRSSVVETNTYPPLNKTLDAVNEEIPTTLLHFLEEIILKNRKGEVDHLKTKCTSISHAIMTSIRQQQEEEDS